MTSDHFKQELIWVIGASSGIGRTLSIALAKQGANLIVSARRQEALKELQQEMGEGHEVFPLDVSDQIEIQETILKISQLKRPLNRVIFMPALYKPDPIATMDLDFMSQMIDVNIKGAMYVTKAILPLFEKQHSGQLAICGSVAGYTGLPNGQPYSATKAAIINFCESLHAETADYIDIKVINPGFVRTPLTAQNDFKMPFIIAPDQAALAIMKGLKGSSFEIHFPKKMSLLLKFLSLLPYGVKLFLTKKMTIK